MSRRAAIIVLDGVGIGEAPDADAYGDRGSDTLGNLARAVGGFSLPHLEKAGLGRISSLAGLRADGDSERCVGDDGPAIRGQRQHDRTLGDRGRPSRARRFRRIRMASHVKSCRRFEARVGRRMIGNVAASGTAVIDRFGPEHQKTGDLDTVYLRRFGLSACSARGRSAARRAVPRLRVAREMLVAPNDVSRVIARPFVGTPGAYNRTKNRRDFSIAPPAETLLDALAAAGVPRSGVGKVDDLFAGRAIESRHTARTPRGSRRFSSGFLRVEQWVTFRELGRFRPGFRAPERRCGVLWSAARVRRGAPSLCLPRFKRTICFSSPPTTETIRRRRRPTTHANACRCWSSDLEFGRVASARARRSRTWVRRWPSGSGSSSEAAGRRFSRQSSADMAVEQRPGVEPTGDERTMTMLRERAFAAMERAYAPYSGFRVGAALLVLGRKRDRRVQRRKRVVPGGYLR